MLQLSRRALVSLAFGFLVAPTAASIAQMAVTNADLVRSADQLFSQTFPAGGPGAAVLVMENGQVLLRKGYGMANVELGVPIQPEMVFELASVTKQFTAAAILMLQERGKLSVEDDITKHLPGYPTHGQKITIHHLLTHMSGIPNFTALPEWSTRMHEDMTFQQVIEMVKDKPLDFKPGETVSYSNSGYILLGAIIEKASGKSYEDFIEQEIFAPLGMKQSRYGRRNEVVPGRVAGYDWTEGGYRIAEYVSGTQSSAAGGLMSTVDDLALWAEALSSEKLLKKASLQQMTTPAKLASGKATPVAYGLGISEEDGMRILEHSGGIPGFNTHVLFIPDRRLSVIVLSNILGQEPGAGSLAYRLAAKALGQESTAVDLDPGTLDEYVGVYRFDEITREVFRKGDKLFSRRRGGLTQEIAASSRDHFFNRELDSRIHFRRDDQGKITAMEFRQRFAPAVVGTRTGEPLPAERQAIQVDPGIFDGYAGVYELGPDLVLTVAREGDHLMAQITGEPKTEIFPESDSKFFLTVADVQLEFQRGADGKATGLTMIQGDQVLPGKKIR